MLTRFTLNNMRRFVLVLFVGLATAPPGYTADDEELAKVWGRASKLHDDGELPEAAKLFEQALTLANKVFGNASKDAAVVRHRLGLVYAELGDYDKSETNYLLAIKIREAKLGKEHEDTIASVQGLGGTYHDMGKYDQAEPLLRRGLEVREAKLGKNHTQTANSLHQLARLYVSKAEYDKAEPLLLRSLAILEKNLDKFDYRLAKVLENLAGVYQAQMEPSRAEPLFVRALKITEGGSGKDHPDTAMSMSNLGDIYVQMNQYRQAEPLFRQALATLEAKLGKEHPTVANTLHSWGQMYLQMAQPTKAEPLAVRALQIREKVYGGEHPEVAYSLGLLSRVYLLTGRYEKAEPLLQRSLRIVEKVFGKDHPDVASALQNLAGLYQRMNLNAKAEPYCLRALAITEAKFEKDHPAVSSAVQNLAVVYHQMDQFKKAEPLYKRALQIDENRFGKEHPQTALTMQNFGMVYKQAAEHELAEPYLNAAVATFEKALGKEHPQTLIATGFFAELKAVQGKQAEALALLHPALQHLRRYTATVLPILSEREQLEFLSRSYRWQLDRGLAFSFAANLTEANKVQIASWLLNHKALAQEALTERELFLRNVETDAGRRTRQELDDVRRQLAFFALRRDEPINPKQLDILQDNETKLLARLTADQRVQRNERWFEMKDVASKLTNKSVYVDFVRLPQYDFIKGNSQADHYVAFLCNAAGEVTIQPLGDAEKIDAAVNAVRKQMANASKTIAQQGEAVAEKALRQDLNALAKFIIEPLKELKDKEEWVLAPDSNLWLVPWAMLPLDEKSYVIEKHRIRYVVSGRDLLATRTPEARTTAPVIMADPDFDTPTRAVDSLRGLSIDFRFGKVNRLPGTAAEAEAVAPRLAKLTQREPLLYTEQKASTATIRATKRPTVLVMSTHGFFLADEKPLPAEELRTQSESKLMENPLLRCGLLLAGCNNATTNDSGVLTGKEVVSCDLRGTKLVVLSACETGLGDVQNGQGVAGLRQAFQLAGAECVVATLWQIPDLQSAQLMTGFFDNLATGSGRSEALQAAQRDMIQKRRERFGAAHPFFWAAFTVTGQDK